MYSAGTMAAVDDGQLVCGITEGEKLLCMGEPAGTEVRVSSWGEQLPNKLVIGNSPVVVGTVGPCVPDVGTGEAFEGE